MKSYSEMLIEIKEFIEKELIILNAHPETEKTEGVKEFSKQILEKIEEAITLGIDCSQCFYAEEEEFE